MSDELLSISIESLPIPTLTKNSLIKAGYKNIEDLRDKFVEDIKDIPGIGQKGFVELKESLFKYKIKFKRKPKPKAIKDAKKTKKIVKVFLGHNKFINWAKELIIAQKLYNTYGDDIFLAEPLPFVKTLGFYLFGKGAAHIEKSLPKKIILIETPKEEEKEEDFPDVVEPLDLGLSKKPKSIASFFKKR